MQYYHTTVPENVAVILKEGLTPKADFRFIAYLEMNEKLARETRTSGLLLEALVNPRVYLWKSQSQGVGRVLEVDIDANHVPMERDYGQLAYFYIGGQCAPKQESREFNLAQFNKMLESYGTKLRVKGESFERDMETIIRVSAEMSDEQWDKEIGSYFVTRPISPKSIKESR